MEFTLFLQQNIYYILFGVLILLMFKTRILSKVYGLQSISVQDAFLAFKGKSGKALFLDVRTKWELDKESKIKKSKAIPLSELSQRMDEVEKLGGSSKKIIIVCRSGSRARSAGVKLKRAGFSDVYVMNGGIMGWQRADYPVTRSKTKVNIG